MIAAILFTVLIGALCLFQLALALGAPWGRLAWGGQHEGRLPTAYRIASGIGILVYAGIALLALDRAGAIDVVPDSVSQIGMWIVFGVLVLGTLMNLISRSKPERFVMTPFALALAVLAFLIAFLGPIAESGATPTPGGTEGQGSTDGQGDGAEISFDPTVSWLEPGRSFTLVTYGSSTCPQEVIGVEGTASDRVTVQLETSGGEVCTADLAPKEQEVTLPQEVSERPVTVLLEFTDTDTRSELTLD